jgi:hypothetical protein
MILAINCASFAIGMYFVVTIMAVMLGAISALLLPLPIIVALPWAYAMYRLNKIATLTPKESK